MSAAYKCVFQPMSEYGDEDAPPIARCGMLAVADGLGGRGAKSMLDEQGVKRTNAYIGSRLCMEAIERLVTPEFTNSVFDGLETECADEKNDEQNNGGQGDREQILLRRIADRIAETVIAALETWIEEYCPEPWTPSGALERTPTTLAFILFRELEDEVDAIAVWAGDSRCLALTYSGLVQLSQDQLIGDPDALTLLRSDSMMSNYISGSSPFTVSCRRVHLPKPCVLLTASDGAFMYLPNLEKMPNPLRMEYELLARLNRPSMEEAWKLIEDGFCRYAKKKDDLSMSFALLSNGGFQDIRRMVIERGNAFREQFSDAWSVATLSEEEWREKLAQQSKELTEILRRDHEDAVERFVRTDTGVMARHPLVAAAMKQAEIQRTEHEEIAGQNKKRLEVAWQKLNDALAAHWIELRVMPGLGKRADALMHLVVDEAEERVVKDGEKLVAQRDELLEKCRQYDHKREKVLKETIGILQNQKAMDRNKARQARNLSKSMTEPFTIRTVRRKYETAQSRLDMLQKRLLPDVSRRMSAVLDVLVEEGTLSDVCAHFSGAEEALRAWQEAGYTMEHPPLDLDDPIAAVREQLCGKLDETGAWLQEQGKSLNPITRRAWKALLRLRALESKKNLIDVQWYEYKPNYERWWSVPEVRSAPAQVKQKERD